jgi:hypothetical protein
MTNSFQHFAPPADFADPRLQADFDPRDWPLCNGEGAPSSGTADLYERRCLQFLALYYQLNRLHRRLIAVRENASGGKRVRALLAEINRILQALESLEDEYAPIGFFGEPVMDGVFYADISFVRPGLPPRSRNSTSYTRNVCVPGLENLPASELRGVLTVTHFEDGCLDL